MASKSEFYALITEAVNDFIEHGFDSQERLDRWLRLLAEAARRALVPERVLARTLAESLTRVYDRTVQLGPVMRDNPSVGHFTLEMIKPKLRAELDRRILSSANLIRLNRDASIARTLQRFSGWATSVPIGGTEIAKRKEVKDKVRRGIAGIPFEERRVVIDQSHKLSAALKEIIAVDGGAIAGEWRHVNERPPAYAARPEHVARNKKFYLIRDSWAHKAGYVKPINGYTDQITAPGEEISCRCTYRYVFNLRDLPADMLTAKGKEALLKARRAIG